MSVKGSGSVELAQVWVPLMPEASKLAGGVEKIAVDAERRFGKATKTMGSQMAASLSSNAEKAAKALKEVERATVALERAKKADADATGRAAVAQQRYNEVAANSKAKESQRAAATEAVARAQRAQEVTASGLTRATAALTAAQAAQAAASKAGSGVMGAGVMGSGLAGMSSRLAAQAEAAGTDSGRKFMAGFSGMLRTGAALAGAGGFLATLKSSIDLGVGMESNLNRFQGVTESNAAMMAKASEKAKQLGADTNIVGASAADAAKAMLELAKGGLTAEQAMAAARGTLQLAAAAQVDAGVAAESQSNILNTYQLGAEKAEHVADVLANVANAAQGEVPDFMLGMQQAGAVAHGFGISMEETVAVLGLFAKAGIRGSDAGTSLKTMLTHIANPSDKASGAMEELGIKTHNAAGQFVGMREMFRQIGEAQKRMRADDFQRATAELFGTDAIRGAMIAGNQGIATLDQMAAAVQVAGGAGRMAAANMQGVPGVIEKISNSADTAKLALYDLIKPLIESGGNKFVDWLSNTGDALERLKKGGGGAAFQGLKAGWRDISAAVKDIAPTLMKITREMAKGVGGAALAGWQTFGTVLHAIEPPLRAVAGLFASVPGLASGVAVALSGIYLKSKLTGPALSAAAKATGLWERAFSGWRTEASQADRTMTAFRTATGETTLVQRGFATMMRDTYRSASSEATRFHRTVGATKSVMSGLKTMGSGLLSAFGGPWGVAVTGATLGLTWLANKHAEAAAKAEEQRAAEKALQDQLEASSGVLTKDYLDSLSKRLQDKGMFDTAKSLGVDPAKLIEAATSRDEAAYDELKALASRSGPENKAKWTALLQVVMDEIIAFQRSSKAVKERSQAMEHAGEATEEAVEHFKKLGAAIVDVPNAKTIVVKGLTAEAIEDLRKAGFAVQQIPGTKEVVITADTDQAKAEWQQWVRQVENTHPKVGIGADMQTADNVIGDWIAQLQHKPIQLPATVTQLPANDPLNTLPGVNLPPRAKGGIFHGLMQSFAYGKLPDRAMIQPSAGRGLVQWAEAETGGEAFIPLRGGRRSAAIWAETGRRLGILPAGNVTAPDGSSDNGGPSGSGAPNLPDWWRERLGKVPLDKAWMPPYREQLPPWVRSVGMRSFAGGGILDDLEQVADELSGVPYVTGGHSFAGVDCSGAASMLVLAALGLPVTGERMSTGTAAEWLAAKGFRTGKGPAGTLRVGWYNGGPGGGHMAVTLPDGRHAEAGGSHGKFMVGAGAAGAEDAQFTSHAYLPMEALYPDGDASGGGGRGRRGRGGGSGGGGGRGGRGGGGGGYASEEAKDQAVAGAQNRLQDAEARVTEAQQRLREVEANGKAKESERTHARDQLAKAERDRDLAKEKLETAQSKPVGGRGDDDDGYGNGGQGSGPDAKSFGSDMLKGALEALGFDGQIFSDPTQWGIWKLLTGGVNYFGGIAKNFNAPAGARGAGGGVGTPSGIHDVGDGGIGAGYGDSGGGGGGALFDIAGSMLPQVRDVLPPQPTVVPGMYGGQLTVDNSINFGGNVGMGPKEVGAELDARRNDRLRTNMTGLPQPA